MPQTDWYSKKLVSGSDKKLIEMRSSDYSDDNMGDLFNGSLLEGDIVMIAGHLFSGTMQVAMDAEVYDDKLIDAMK